MCVGGGGCDVGTGEAGDATSLVGAMPVTVIKWYLLICSLLSWWLCGIV